MGFFDGIIGSKKTKVPASGYYAMPKGYQDLFSYLTNAGQDVFFPGGQLNADMFTPAPISETEQGALDNINQGFAPTPESLKKDISMFMNPFDENVIGSINREAQGANSLVNQAATRAGQQGSNRSFLGSSDVEQNRLNNIGTFRQGQYNATIDTILNSLIPNRRQDAVGQLSAGDFERQLDMQTKQAPVSALNAGSSFLGSIPTSFGGFGSPEATIKTGGGLSGILGAVKDIAGLFNPAMGALNSLGGGFSAGQSVGSMLSSSPTGPYRNYGGFFG